MTHQEAEQIAKELTELFKPKYSDLVAHVDLVNGTDKINISFFWDRISKENWKEAKTFRLKTKDYHKTLENEIIPFFKY